jgi:hypothetical protein
LGFERPTRVFAYKDVHNAGGTANKLVAKRVIKKLRGPEGNRFDVRIRGELEYPARLREATYPVEFSISRGVGN